MPLKSATFAGDERLEACLVEDRAHLTLGVQGEFVAKVQAALIFVDAVAITDQELETLTYGKSTAAAVLAFKKKRRIINRAYQQTEDDIVGKMTIRALDEELKVAEDAAVDLSVSPTCIGQL
jgi:hypothetical protein